MTAALIGPEEFSGTLGVFDSGVGGLTVVEALLQRFPRERILYIADQAHVPYGGRPLGEICAFASGISAFLAEKGCRAIIMACNISSATALPSVREALNPLPVLGVIAPATRRAMEAVGPEPAPRIGVLATVGTVRSGAYTAHLRALAGNRDLFVEEIGCPKFVPLVEAERTQTPEADAAAKEYLSPLAEVGCTTIILGCTHYPFLLPTLHRAAETLFPYPVTFIDPATEMADALLAVLPDAGHVGNVPTISSNVDHPNDASLFLTTGDAASFRQQTPCFLPGIAPASYQVAAAAWEQGKIRVLLTE